MINGFVWIYADRWDDLGWCTREVCDTVDSAKQAADDYLKRVRHGAVGEWEDAAGGTIEQRYVGNDLLQTVSRTPLRRLKVD